MGLKCNNCGSKKLATIPFVVHEATISKKDRTIKRLWIALVVVTSMLAASNAVWFMIK
jgi:hypothetical protein